MSLGLNVPVITPFASACFIDPYPAYWMAAAHEVLSRKGRSSLNLSNT